MQNLHLKKFILSRTKWEICGIWNLVNAAQPGFLCLRVSHIHTHTHTRSFPIEIVSLNKISPTKSRFIFIWHSKDEKWTLWLGNSPVLSNLTMAHNIYVYSSLLPFSVYHSFYVLFLLAVWLSWVIYIPSRKISKCLGIQAFSRVCLSPWMARSRSWELELCCRNLKGGKAVQWKIRGWRSCFANHPLNFWMVWYFGNVTQSF